MKSQTYAEDEESGGEEIEDFQDIINFNTGEYGRRWWILQTEIKIQKDLRSFQTTLVSIFKEQIRLFSENSREEESYKESSSLT